MNDQPEQILPLVKALTNAERLKVIGLLCQRPASLKEVADELHLPTREALNHLAFLEHVAVIRKLPASEGQEARYEIDSASLEQIAKSQLSSEPRERYGLDLDKKSQQVLRTYLNADGTIRELPIRQPDKLRVLLNYLVESFTPGVDYTEKEVNLIIRRFNVDVAGLRRDLIDAGLLARERDGSRYWRPVEKDQESS